MSHPLLQAQDLYKSYGRHKVLRGVSFAIVPGTLVGIVGENGAGKSTLLRILGGRCATEPRQRTAQRRDGVLSPAGHPERYLERQPAPRLLPRRVQHQELAASRRTHRAARLSTLPLRTRRSPERWHKTETQSDAGAHAPAALAAPGRTLSGIRLGDLPVLLGACHRTAAGWLSGAGHLAPVFRAAAF